MAILFGRFYSAIPREALCALVMMSFSACGLQIIVNASLTATPGIPNKPVQVALSGGTACAFLDTGATKCWGNNLYGIS